MTLMTPLSPPGLPVARRDQLLAHILAVTVLAVPVLIATVALIPALVVCPFLGAGRQRLMIRLLASLRQWTAVLTTASPAAPGEREDLSRPGGDRCGGAELCTGACGGEPGPAGARRTGQRRRSRRPG
jgi:hypothetical protein